MTTDIKTFWNHFTEEVSAIPITGFAPRVDAHEVLQRLTQELEEQGIDVTTDEWKEMFARCARHARAHASAPAAPYERVFVGDDSPRAQFIRSRAPFGAPGVFSTTSDGKRYHVYPVGPKVFHPITERGRKK